MNLRQFAVDYGRFWGLREGLGGPENGIFSRKTGNYRENRTGWGLILFSCMFPVFLLGFGLRRAGGGPARAVIPSLLLGISRGVGLCAGPRCLDCARQGRIGAEKGAEGTLLAEFGRFWGSGGLKMAE